MTWDAELQELKRRQKLAEQMGGTEKVSRQHGRGKLDARARIEQLLDADSFHEVGKISGSATYSEDGQLADLAPANFIFGRGKINGRPVVVAVDDFTVRGGAADASIVNKQIDAERMAAKLRVPLIRLLDGTGGGGSVRTLDSGNDKHARTYIPRNPAWEHVVSNLHHIPVISLLLGPVVGLGAARAVTSHHSIMVKGLSQLFVAGPPIAARLGEDVDKEQLGGSKIHTRNGSIDTEVLSEQEAFAAARSWLSYMPSSVYECPPCLDSSDANDSVDRRDDSLLDIVPRDRRQVYDMYKIIQSVFDLESFVESGKFFGRSAITGFARLDGKPVAVLAGNPRHYGGGWTADTAQKVTRFVDLAETFHLPVVHLVDNPGFLVGTASEKASTIRYGARTLAAIYNSSVPWCSVIIRKVFGVAGAGHSNASEWQYRYCWPSGDWGSLPVEGGVEAAYSGMLAEIEDPEERQQKVEEITERLNRVRSPFRTAESYLAEEIIDPRDTRPLLCEFADHAYRLLTPGGNPTGMRYRP